MRKSGTLGAILLLFGLVGCANPSKDAKPAEEVSQSEKIGTQREPHRSVKPHPSPMAEGPVIENNAHHAFVCNLQVMITKFEAYGTSIEEAREKIREKCREKFPSMHCIDEEDLHCRKTFY